MNSLQVLGETSMSDHVPNLPCPVKRGNGVSHPQNTLEMLNYVEFEPNLVYFLILGEEMEGIVVGLLNTKEMSVLPFVFPES